MQIPHRRQPVLNAFCLLWAAIAFPGPTAPAFGFVFLDTSGPGVQVRKDSASRKDAGIYIVDTSKSLPILVPLEATPDSPPVPAVPAPNNKDRPHYGTVLFLSADSKLVYAYLGVLKALEEFGLEPDAILAESKAVALGAAWALGYSAASLEKEWLRRPLEGYLRPWAFPERAPERAFRPYGSDALQWDIPLGLQSLQSPGAKWSAVTLGESGEHLHLSWMVAQLTHDAPNGPVEELSETPRRLAVQVSDLTSEKEAVLTEGGLQGILKGSLLPADVIRQRKRLWPYASGSLLSGHAIMAGKLPFSCDRIIVLQPGRRLRPPALENGPTSWTDSLDLRAMRRGAGKTGSSALEGATGTLMAIELEPEGEFDPAETDPRRWIGLGYTSALRSMDILRPVMAEGRVPPQGASRKPEGRLGLNRLSVNPLASGGRQLLLDIIRDSEGAPGDSTGEGAISALVKSGFYSDLDLEWSQEKREDRALLIFDAKEKSRIDFRAGYNFTFAGEEIPDRAPEVYGGLEWSEPFYIPFEGNLGLLLGGHQPGYEGRVMIAPVYPLRLELGLTRTHWEVLYPFNPPTAARNLGARYLRLDRTLSEVFLKIFPLRFAYLRTAIQKHEMELRDLPEEEPSFLSTDFQETAFLGLGRQDAQGVHPYTLHLRFRNLNRVNTFGQVRYATSSLESRFRIKLGDFRLSDQYYWSDQSGEFSTSYDLLETGIIDAFTFQDEFFLRYLRSTHFQDVKIEYCPVFGKAGLRLIAGGYRDYGAPLFSEQPGRLTYGHKPIPLRLHWEAQAGYVTPLGTVRAGMGGLDGNQPFYFLRLGTGFELGFDTAD